jgi:hypothetical protein
MTNPTNAGIFDDWLAILAHAHLFGGKDMYFGNARPWYVLRCDPPRFVCGLKSLR